MFQQEVEDSLIPNSFLLVAAVAKTAITDAMQGESSAQRWLDLVAPTWREKWKPPPASWEIDLDALETPPSICERCRQPFERTHSQQKYCAGCRAEVKRERERQSKKKSAQVNKTPVAILPPAPRPPASFKFRKELV